MHTQHTQKGLTIQQEEQYSTCAYCLNSFALEFSKSAVTLSHSWTSHGMTEHFAFTRCTTYRWAHASLKSHPEAGSWNSAIPPNPFPPQTWKQHPQCYYFKISYKNFWEAKSQVLRGWFAVSKKPNDWTINMNTSNWSDLCKKTREKEKSRISLPREDCELSPSCTPEHESIFLQSITSAKVLTFICAPNTQSGM